MEKRKRSKIVMKYIIFSFFIILCSLTSCFGEAVNIGIFSSNDFDSLSSFLDPIEKQFPNINGELIKYSSLNFKSVVKSSLSRYDIYFYDSRYTKYIAPYLSNLKEYLPKEHIDMYDSKLINEMGIYKNELVGLPINLSYDVLYSNKELLNKYNKRIPKTWDELIETCKYIMEKENDPELICYNGLFNDDEQGLYSLYEFIYSCRDSYNSTYPYPQDPSFINSLAMLKKLKEEIASDEIFNSNENFTFMKLMNKNSIFLKYWFVNEPLRSSISYQFSILPGLKEGISGSMILGTNVGIIRDLSNEKEEVVLDVLKYITSKEYQKKLSKKDNMIPAITELLDDKEICIGVPCDLTKNLQLIGEPNFIKEGPDHNKKNYQRIIYQYLYRNATVEETLKQISNDIDMSSGVSNGINMTFIQLLVLLAMNILSLMILY